MIKLLVTDLDDTLYSWIGFFVPAFYAMAEEVAAITHVDFRVILSEYKTIHRERVCQDDFCKFSKFKYLSAEKTPNISCRHIS